MEAMNIRRYGVIGSGPIGLTLAACLAKASRAVSLLCIEAEQRVVLEASGVTIRGEVSAAVRSMQVFVDLDSFLACGSDVILIATKGYDLRKLLTDIKDKGVKDKGVEGNCVFVSCQNGIDVEEEIVSVFGRRRALRMVLNLGCDLVKPNEVDVRFFFTNYLSLVEEVSKEMLDDFVTDLNRGGFKTELKADYKAEVFKKAILNCAGAPICALTGMTMKAAIDVPELFNLSREVVREGEAVARAAGFDLGRSFFDEAMAYLSKGGDHKPSMLIDIERLTKTENDWLGGKICEYARRYGVKVPVMETMYSLIRGLEKKGLERKNGP